jgi:hypothetical protein
MIARRLALTCAASLALAGCVSTRQVADVEFQPPQGTYNLVVMRPDVSVGSVTAGGLVEPRAEWTEQARANLLAALRDQQAGRGGRTLIAETRESLPGVDPGLVADLERLHGAVGNSIALHKYLGAELPTKRRGIDWTLGQDAVKLGQATGMDYALFLNAQDAVASTGRVAMQVLGLAGCFRRLLRAAGRRRQAPMLAGRSQDRATSSGSTYSRPAASCPASPWGYPHARGRRADGRTLLGRMRPAATSGTAPDERHDHPPRPARLRVLRRPVGPAQARISPKAMTPLVQAGYRPTETDEKGLWQQYERIERDIADSNLLIRDPALTSYLSDITGRSAARRRGTCASMWRASRVQRLHGADRVHGGVLGLLTRMRDEAQLSGVIATRPGTSCAATMSAAGAISGARPMRSPFLPWARASAAPQPVSIWATPSSLPSSAPSSRCSPTAASWKPRRTPWGCA